MSSLDSDPAKSMNVSVPPEVRLRTVKQCDLDDCAFARVLAVERSEAP